jgi:hypothetical protein
MTLINSQEINCLKCGHIFSATIHSSVNVSIAPDLKGDLLTGKLNQATCPKCNMRYDIGGAVLYHDMNSRIMIYALLSEEYSTDRERAIEEFSEIMRSSITNLARAIRQNFEKYNFDIVFSIDELKESLGSMTGVCSEKIRAITEDVLRLEPEKKMREKFNIIMKLKKWFGKSSLKDSKAGEPQSSFTKNVSQKDIASGLYIVVIRDRIKEPVRDADGKIVFSTIEQKKLLLTQLYVLLKMRNLDSAKDQLLAAFVMDNNDIKDNGDLYIQMNFILDEIKKIQDFFGSLFRSAETDDLTEFSKHDFLFGKKLNPMRIVFTLSWYVENLKATDVMFEQVFKKVNAVKE